MAENLGAARPLLSGLTGIRAIAAGWVVLDHFSKTLFGLFPTTEVAAPWIHGGFLGVEVFFILSGFIIAYQYADRFSTFSGSQYRKFAALRFARIYPVHLVTLLFVAAIAVVSSVVGLRLNLAEGFTPSNFLANLAMLQAIPPFEGFNGPAWSICAEFAAYLAFPALALALAGIRTPSKAFLTSAAVSLVGVASMLLVLPLVGASSTSYPLMWLRIATEFTVGCFLFAGWRLLGDRRFGAGWDVAACVSSAGVGAVLWVTDGTAYAIASIPLIAVFVLSCAGATGPVGGFLASKPMIWFGRISYSVYMTHYILLLMLGKALPWDRFEANLMLSLGYILACAVGVIAAGAAMFYLVEEPGRHLIRRLAERLPVERPKEPSAAK
ncbi:acyltransferase family protein [Arthrobacter sp. MPF02]|uniref:acyltransferase family protein n=1 Tax=Arthrobacter sp. MPF02 TaxID=3388492 RepID=UPI0039851D5A